MSRREMELEAAVKSAGRFAHQGQANIDYISATGAHGKRTLFPQKAWKSWFEFSNDFNRF